MYWEQTELISKNAHLYPKPTTLENFGKCENIQIHIPQAIRVLLSDLL